MSWFKKEKEKEEELNIDILNEYKYLSLEYFALAKAVDMNISNDLIQTNLIILEAYSNVINSIIELESYEQEIYDKRRKYFEILQKEEKIVNNEKELIKRRIKHLEENIEREKKELEKLKTNK